MLVDLFTLDFGLIRAVAKGARRENSRSRALLQLFQPLLISVSGKGEVKTLTSIESNMSAMRLQGERLFSGLYLNELLCRLLQNQEEHAGLYKATGKPWWLTGYEQLEPLLRRFEMNLLAELGYAINLEHDWKTDLPIVAGSVYRFIPDLGFEASSLSAGAASGPTEFRGADLIALREMDFADEQTLLAAKRLLRLALSGHLGDKPLHSRGCLPFRLSVALVEEAIEVQFGSVRTRWFHAYPSIDNLIGNTPLVRLQQTPVPNKNTILLKLEGNNPAGSIKDRPALNMILQAERRGEISPGDRLIEATSGNTGIALAMVAAAKGYRMT